MNQVSFEKIVTEFHVGEVEMSRDIGQERMNPAAEQVPKNTTLVLVRVDEAEAEDGVSFAP